MCFSHGCSPIVDAAHRRRIGHTDGPRIPPDPLESGGSAPTPRFRGFARWTGARRVLKMPSSARSRTAGAHGSIGGQYTQTATPLPDAGAGWNSTNKALVQACPADTKPAGEDT